LTFFYNEGAADHVSQGKALVAKLHHKFKGEADMVQQHHADIAHLYEQCGIIDDFPLVINESNIPLGSMAQ
jgi:hypothetical protein